MRTEKRAIFDPKLCANDASQGIAYVLKHVHLDFHTPATLNSMVLSGKFHMIQIAGLGHFVTCSRSLSDASCWLDYVYFFVAKQQI